MAESKKKSLFTRAEQPLTPVLGPDAERFVRGSDTPPTEVRAESAPSPEAAHQVEKTSTKPEPLKRLTIDIPASLHTRVKSQCAAKGTTIADVVRKYLERAFPEEDRRKDS